MDCPWAWLLAWQPSPHPQPLASVGTSSYQSVDGSRQIGRVLCQSDVAQCRRGFPKNMDIYTVSTMPQPVNRCRLCRATSYRRVIERDGSGALTATSRFRCSGCSITFSEPRVWRDGDGLTEVTDAASCRPASGCDADRRQPSAPSGARTVASMFGQSAHNAVDTRARGGS